VERYDVSLAKLIRLTQCLHATVIERVDVLQKGGQVVVTVKVRPVKHRRSRCPHCERRCPGYDRGEGLRAWRGLDLGPVWVYLQAQAPRVRCPEHGVVVAETPWARPGVRFTRAFDEHATWLAARMSVSTVATYLRSTWRSVTGAVARVTTELAGTTDRLTGLRRIGIDEISYRKGQRYILRVVDHDTGRQVWAGEGANQDTLLAFFKALGWKRARTLTHVTSDGAEWIHTVVKAKAKRAKLCMDPFHVVQWATKAIDAIRRRVQGELTRAGRPEQAKTLKGSRWALLRNIHELDVGQKATLAGIQRDNKLLYRAYLLKEQLRYVFAAATPSRAKSLLAGWLAWVKKSKIPEFVAVAATVEKMRDLIWNSLDTGLSNALSEATNNHLRLLTRRAYGYHSAEALIAMSELTLGGLCPPLPGRA
jgi:transposase